MSNTDLATTPFNWSPSSQHLLRHPCQVSTQGAQPHPLLGARGDAHQAEQRRERQLREELRVDLIASAISIEGRVESFTSPMSTFITEESCEVALHCTPGAGIECRQPDALNRSSVSFASPSSARRGPSVAASPPILCSLSSPSLPCSLPFFSLSCLPNPVSTCFLLHPTDCVLSQTLHSQPT